jgi:hypothetical protein
VAEPLPPFPVAAASGKSVRNDDADDIDDHDGLQLGLAPSDNSSVDMHQDAATWSEDECGNIV